MHSKSQPLLSTTHLNSERQRYAKRTLSNVKMHDSPQLPRGSTAQLLLQRRHNASGVPRLPREVHVHHARSTHILHDKPSIQRHAHVATIPHTCHAKPPRDTRGETLFVTNPNGTAPRGHRRTPRDHARSAPATRREHGPPPRPPLKNKNPSLRIRE